jgi:hypothetical protein
MKQSIMAVSLLVLAACGGDSPDAGSDEGTVGKEIADGYREQLDEAAAVEDELDAARERRDAAVEDGGGSGRE